MGNLHPNEFAFDATYALKLNDNLSLGATGRFMRSDLTNGQTISDGSGNTATKAANSLAADIGLYYQKTIDKQQEFALGAFISNLGAKLSYSDEDNDKEFLPANLRLGGRYTNKIDDYNKVSVMLDFNKLLVPTPPLNNNTQEWAEYNRLDVIQGAIQSFSDAPRGMSEELEEVHRQVPSTGIRKPLHSVRVTSSSMKTKADASMPPSVSASATTISPATSPTSFPPPPFRRIPCRTPSASRLVST